VIVSSSDVACQTGFNVQPITHPSRARLRQLKHITECRESILKCDCTAFYKAIRDCSGGTSLSRRGLECEGSLVKPVSGCRDPIIVLEQIENISEQDANFSQGHLSVLRCVQPQHRLRDEEKHALQGGR
jgi:hypothetical protein